jgi:Peptidase family M20/M25/M40
VLRTRSLDEGGQPAALPSTGTPLDPETRIYARSASDDKASIVAMMAAPDAITAAGLRPRSNVRFVVDGEEEAGSTNLERVLGVRLVKGMDYRQTFQRLAPAARGHRPDVSTRPSSPSTCPTRTATTTAPTVRLHNLWDGIETMAMLLQM